jgi:hypothetical protein
LKDKSGLPISLFNSVCNLYGYQNFKSCDIHSLSSLKAKNQQFPLQPNERNRFNILESLTSYLADHQKRTTGEMIDENDFLGNLLYWILDFFYKIDMTGLIPKPNEDPRYYIMDGR